MGTGARRPRKSAPRVNMPMSTAWPPAEFDIQATLVQPACCKCRRPQYRVRRIRHKSEHLWAEDCASVCDECWSATLVYMGENLVNLQTAFWAAKPVEPTRTAGLVNLLDFVPHKCTAQIWLRFKASRRRLRVKKPSD